MKDKLKEKYVPESYMRRLLNKLHNLHQCNMSIQHYMTIFDDLTLHCEVQEDRHQGHI